ncbi:hypothetical protein FAUST_1437 [Fusarium austroamericanum]|uniref:Uncharacterized protein n=1 Tax=Fusarium austroamericanum TaxID=282268 RepID=A0AAN6HJN4_FUSAU|nr:hypothetical protein FAUST_1437 [Fusarium austroamericanum]
MDFLSRLPDLILVNIFGLMHSERDIFHLISASPHFLSIYTHYRHSITRQRLSAILKLDVDGSILQDAQAIIQFPAILGCNKGDSRRIKKCLDTWDERGFPNPLMEERNPESVTSLYNFFARVIFFIEDYLSKAADPFPVRAYMTLPTMSRLAPTMRFKGQDIDIEHVPLNDLSQSGRRRILQAFIRFELRCKVYRTPAQPKVKGTIYMDIMRKADEHLTIEEHEEIYCVGEYFKGMYGAIIAHSNDDVWFPDRPAPATVVVDELVDDKQHELSHANDYGLLFPDNHYIGLNTYLFDADIQGLRWIQMPCSGLDSITSLLQYINSGSRSGPQIRDWVKNFPIQNSHCRWTSRGHFAQRYRLYSISADVKQWATEMQFSEPVNLRDLKVSATGMYRQRAMTFFTGSTGRQPLLPSWKNLFSQQERLRGIVYLAEHRGRRRSQKWQDYWAGRT